MFVKTLLAVSLVAVIGFSWAPSVQAMGQSGGGAMRAQSCVMPNGAARRMPAILCQIRGGHSF